MQRHPTVDRTVAFGRRLLALVQREEIPFLAAAIAYYAFVSLVPSLTLLFAVASLLGGEELAAAIIDTSGAVLSPVGRDLVRDALRGESGRAPATVVSLLLLAWGALKVFRGIDVAFSQVYGVAPASSFLGRVRDAAVVLGGVGAALAAVVGISALVSLSGVPLGDFLGTVGLIAALSVAFFPLFYLVPDRDDPALLAVPGTALAAAGWTLLGTVFRVYAGIAGGSSVYGVLGVVILLVTWFYVGSMVLLVGAAFNAVLAGRTGLTGTNKDPPDDSETNGFL